MTMLDDHTSRVKPSPCPSCGKSMDAATGMEKRTIPRPGDVTVCLYCRAVMRWDDEMALRMLTPDEVAEVAAETPLLARALKIAGHFQSKGRSGSE